jgi:hypothetical protein
MGYLTENKLRNVVDLPIGLPDTTLKQGDWVIISTVKVVAPQRLSMRSVTMQLLESSVDTSLIVSGNKVVPNLGLVYVVLRKDYASGVPGGTGALDYMLLDDLGTVVRSTVPVVLSSPGNYSLICANNMQPSNLSTISTSSSIDFKVLVTGQFRLELSGA